MARFLFIVCVLFAVGFIAILRGPGLDFFGNGWDGATEETRSSAARTAEESASATSGTTSSAARRLSRAAAARPRASYVETSPAGSGPESPFVNVLTDPVPVYSFNSSNSEVLRVLQEGDQVEFGLEILTPEGRWVEVRLDSQTSGFMLSENLGRSLRP